MRDKPKSIRQLLLQENASKTTGILFSTKWCSKGPGGWGWGGGGGERGKESGSGGGEVRVGQVDKLLKILVGALLVSLSVICQQNYYLVVIRYIWCFCCGLVFVCILSWLGG